MNEWKNSCLLGPALTSHTHKMLSSPKELFPRPERDGEPETGAKLRGVGILRGFLSGQNLVIFLEPSLVHDSPTCCDSGELCPSYSAKAREDS